MKKFVELTVWGKDWEDDSFMISNSYGFSLDNLLEMKQQIEEDTSDLDEYLESVVTLEVTYSEAQIGNYPPPNVEADAYWHWAVVKIEKFEDNPKYSGEGFEELLELPF